MVSQSQAPVQDPSRHTTCAMVAQSQAPVQDLSRCTIRAIVTQPQAPIVHQIVMVNSQA
jgi:hypothetical protein